MVFTPSFEYGRDISLLSGALRSAERTLQKQDPASTLRCVDRERSRPLALAISSGIQGAYKTSSDHYVVHSRIHCVLFANTMWSSGIVDRSELDYFESVLDNFPQVGWNLFLALVEVCNWRQCYVSCVQALPLKMRLQVLKATMEFAEDSSYIWSCAFSALWWSACIEPHLRSTQNSDDSTLTALSRLRPASPVDKLKLDPVSLLQASAKHFLGDGCPRRRLRQLRRSCPSSARSSPSDDWLANMGDAADEIAEDFYATRRPECATCFPVDVVRDQLRASEDVIQAVACILDSSRVSELFSRERDEHPYCSMDGVCANLLMAAAAGKSRPNVFEALGEPALLHSAGKLRRALVAVSSLTDSAPLRRLQRVVSEWGHNAPRDLPREVCQNLVGGVVQSLEQGSSQRAELILWSLSLVDLFREQRIIDTVKKHLALLSHPRLFLCLIQAAKKAGDVDAFKELVLDVCDAAPLKLQRAMLSYVMSEAGGDLSLRLSSFPGQLTQKLNLICDTQGGSDVLDGLTSLCLQSPSEVVRGLVDLAVADGCATLVCQILEFLGSACRSKDDATGQRLLVGVLGDCFERLLARPSKRSTHYVSLLGELRRVPDLVDWDAFRQRVVPYLEPGGAEDPAPDEFFPVRVSMVRVSNCAGGAVAERSRLRRDVLETLGGTRSYPKLKGRRAGNAFRRVEYSSQTAPSSL
ncbi:uncharacterized protein ISCGN_015603 [Ixodes scapularis]